MCIVNVSIRLMCGFVALDTSCCSLTGLSDWCWLLLPWKPATVVSLVYQIDVGVLWSPKPPAVVCGFGCQLAWCYWCIRLMLGFMASDISYCGVTGVADWCWVLWLWTSATVVLQLYQIDTGFYVFRHQLLWCYWCIRLMLGFMALDISYCGIAGVSD